MAHICLFEMLYFDAVKCDLFHAREVSFSLKMLGKMTIIGVKLVNCDSIVQIRVKISRRPFRGRHILDNYSY